MEAVGLRLPVGSACSVHLAADQSIDAEVVGFDGDKLFLMPHSDLGVTPGAPVIPEQPVTKSGGSGANKLTVHENYLSDFNYWVALLTVTEDRLISTDRSISQSAHHWVHAFITRWNALRSKTHWMSAYVQLMPC
jgi:hypothetical protein